MLAFIDLLIACLFHWNTSLMKAWSLVYSPLCFGGQVQCMKWNSFQMLNDSNRFETCN